MQQIRIPATDDACSPMSEDSQPERPARVERGSQWQKDPDACVGRIYGWRPTNE